MADDIITSVARIVNLNEIYSVQHMGSNNYQVTVNSRAAATTLIQFKSIHLGDQVVPLVPVGPLATNVTCLFLPSSVPDDALTQALRNHGTITEIRHGTFKSQPSVRTGTRYVTIRMKEENPVPNYIRVGGHRAVFDYPGVKRVCRRCKQEGHIGAECAAPFCERCGIYGHPTEPCDLPCRRCSAPHATTSCPTPPLYSAVAGGSQASAQAAPIVNSDAFPPLASANPVNTSKQPGSSPPALHDSPKDSEDTMPPEARTTPPPQGTQSQKVPSKEEGELKTSTPSPQQAPLSPDVQSLVRNLEHSAQILKEAEDDATGDGSSPNSPAWPRWEGSSEEDPADEEMTDKETDAPTVDGKRTRSSDDGITPSSASVAAVPKKKKNRSTGKKK